MTRAVLALWSLTTLLFCCRTADAQEPMSRVGPFVVDFRVSIPKFTDNPLVAASRQLMPTELPGHGLGLDVGAHVYPLRLGPVTIGIGGALTVSRGLLAADATAGTRAVTERFTSIGPQLSLNFKGKSGWSYLSGGIARSTWYIVPDGSPPFAADEAAIRTFNIGAGGRWFPKRHLAVNIDVHVHIIPVGAQVAATETPQTLLLFIGAGISVR